jgi:tetratricopeptide (TPR) repeat protein
MIMAGLVAIFGLAYSQDTKLLLLQADELWAQRADIERCRQAIATYEKVLAVDTNNYEAAWKIARACYWLGIQPTEEDKVAIFEKGIESAKKAIAIKDNDPAGHFWLGVSYGKYGEAKGILKSLSLVDPTKEEMERVLELDPNFESGGAYRVLGRLYYKLPGLFGGSNKKSIENLKKSIEIDPERLLTHVFLAEVYIDTDKQDLARKELEFVANSPPKKGYEPESAMEKEQAKELLKKLP